ncbi:hypothetical protein [Mycoplasmopsis cynos]|uniref:hypothetical protein n=1 Tax=Mycoplasmopsis cynos TaxID=171284 RepID=UPI002AFF432A|nr:hypothetical protein [Mycoplasmopsis cynos]WQQ17902.1 hypothetical protein RRG56_01165 [Mycoplasmopsis cynos]
MEQIKIFKTYKLNESLKKGIEGYSKIKCEKIMPIIKIFDDILFGIVFEKDVNPSVKIYQKAQKNYYLYFDRFFRISNENLMKNIIESNDETDVENLGDEKELEILEKIRNSFESKEENIKLTYIYKKTLQENASQ